MSVTRELTSTCPVCDASVSLSQDIRLNELVPCADCGSELEVVGLSPLQVEQAPEIEEDWGE